MAKHIHIRLHDGPSYREYALKMAAAARSERERAVKQAAVIVHTFGGSSDVGKQALNEAERHQKNYIYWSQLGRQSHQTIGKMIRNKQIPASAFGYGVRIEDAQKFDVEYSAKNAKGKSVSFRMSVTAPDKYAAGDKVKAEAERRFGKDLYYPVLKFGGSKLAQGSISHRVSRSAGPEEDE